MKVIQLVRLDVYKRQPLIFGMPVMLNPIFFIPMVFCNVVMGLIGLAATHIFTFTYNPAMSLLPWTTPFFVKAFMAGGISLLIMVLILLAVNTLMYYPFFKIADKKAYEEEQLAKAGGNIESCLLYTSSIQAKFNRETKGPLA